MSYFQIERLPDARRTLLRLIVSVAPSALFVVFRLANPNAGFDPLHSAEMVQFEESMTRFGSLAAACVSVSIFTLWQGLARNILSDDGGAAWISLHGWEGEVDKLPQRGLLPFSELFGLIGVTLLFAQVATVSLLLLPMCWSVVRSAHYWEINSQERPFAFGTCWLLHATAIWLSATWWLALPLELTAILLGEMMSLSALRRTADDMLTSDLKIYTKKFIFKASRSPIQQGTSNYFRNRLFPFAQLEVVLGSKKPSWLLSIWTAAVVAWSMFCLTSALAQFGNWIDRQGTVIPIYVLIGNAGMFVLIAIGVLKTIGRFEPYLWWSRLGLLARIRSLRPLVWLWDRILVPHAITITAFVISLQFGASITPVAFGVLSFLFVLILQQAGVTPDEWQMTSDARLTSALISSNQRNHPNN